MTRIPDFTCLENMLSNLPNRTLIGGRWETVNLLGEGACAQVYNVRATQGNIGYELVAKVVPFAKGKNKQQERICNTLNYEYVMYNGLMSGFPHRPRTPDKFYGDDKVLQVRYLVMERLDRDLIALSRNPGEVNSSLVAGIGLQILNGLEWIHQKGFLFIDVKPDNFMLKGADVFFVDCKLRYLLRRKYVALTKTVISMSVGLIERLVVIQPGQTPPQRQFAGTPTFCSVAAHRGDQPSAHDDLEAMV
jgi:serine/threonine protein kinase